MKMWYNVCMEQLRNHFNRITRKNPYLSSLICFNETMKTRSYYTKIITVGFRSLVNKDDYPRKHYNELLEQAINLNQKYERS